MAGYKPFVMYVYVYYLLYKAEKPSVRPSTLFWWSMAAWIDIRLARRDSYVFWHDEVYF